VQAEKRHAINVNTATDPIILKSVLCGMSDGTNEIDVDEAEAVAEAFLAHLSGETAPGPYNFFGGNDEDWFDDRGELDTFLAQVAAVLIFSDDKRDMVRNNFNPDQWAFWPQVSTVPLRFNSGPFVGIAALAAVDDAGGTLVAQSPRADGLRLPRFYGVALPVDMWWLYRSQQEFAENDGVDRTSVVTGPLNVNLPDVGADDRYKDTSPGIGTVAPAVGELRYFGAYSFTTMLLGLHGSSLENFNLDFARGAADEEGGVTPEADNTTAYGLKAKALRYAAGYHEDAEARNVEADDFHATMQPLAVEFWIRPGENVTEPQLLFEIGDGFLPPTEDLRNQFSVYLQDGQIVLRMSDQMYDPDKGYRGYVEARSSDPWDPNREFEFEANVWHHVAVAAVGTFKDEIAMFIDGIHDTDVDWKYIHTNGSAEADVDEVAETYFWHVAVEVPNRRYTVDTGPGTGKIWPEGLDRVGLVDLASGDVPKRGIVAIGGTEDEDIYEYENVTGAGEMHLARALERDVAEGEYVTFLVPIVQTARHSATDSPAADEPADGDTVGFWAHEDTSDPDNGAFDAEELPRASVTVDRVIAGEDLGGGAFPDYYKWLVLDPQVAPEKPLGTSMPDALVCEDRWKVFNYGDVWDSPSAPLLAGVLPSGPFPGVYVGGASGGGALFEGELDELRVTALPTGHVAQDDLDDWAAGDEEAVLQDWDWDSCCGGMLLVRRTELASNPLLHSPHSTPLQWSGGYMLAQGTLYSYQDYDHAHDVVEEIKRPYRNLTPSADVADVGLAAGHYELARVLVLNFVPTTTLTHEYPGTDEKKLKIEDSDMFPEPGYVQIDEEIIGYSHCSDLERDEAYPRGAYGTNVAGHSAGALVRYVPVRHVDRYRANDVEGDGDPWDGHQAYESLDGDMCTVKFTLPCPGRLRRIFWRFRNELEDGQKVAVLLRTDDGVAWNADPDDLDDGDDGTSGDGLWGTLVDEHDDQSGWLDLYSVAADGTHYHPIVSGSAQVRFYFDLGDASVYRHSYDTVNDVVEQEGWVNMIELDTVGVEMVPESETF